jgi:exopolyphosphatase/guanosine-5'-triphosphate,3'-diphosphate pyrophosphatase
MKRAVIDVGSNSVLRLVSAVDGEWNSIYEDTRVPALGESTKQTGLLGERGMSETLSALREFFKSAREHGATQILAGATMAARIATNAGNFLIRAREQGTPVFILSGEEEADLGFRAVAEDPLFRNQARISIIDPGGHSTELVTADSVNSRWQIQFRKSFPIGTLAMRGGAFQDERVTVASTFKGVEELDRVIGMTYRPGECGECVVLGATGTNLISIREKLDHWQPERVHGAHLDYEEVSKAYGWLSAMSDSERAQVQGMEPGREKTIHLGALILERFLFALRAEYVRVSTKGWRHALLASAEFDQFLSRCLTF